MTTFAKFDVITVTPAADVATNGTVTFTYPTTSPARAAASYASASGAKLAARGLQTDFTQGASNFSLAYGASSVVMTYLGATSLPAGKLLSLQIPLAAYDDLTDSTGGAVSRMLAAGVGIKQLAFYTNLADLAAADMLTALTPGYNGKILAIDFFADKPATTAAKAVTLTPKIGSTNVTGGALALTSANCTPQGAKVAGSAITAANVFGPTDTIGIVGSAATAFVEGNGWVVLKVQNMDEVNALASIADSINKTTALLRAREIMPA